MQANLLFKKALSVIAKFAEVNEESSAGPLASEDVRNVEAD